MFASLKTDIWAPALIRRAEAGGAYAAVVHKGDPDAGAVLLLVNTLDGQVTLYRPARNMDGERIWMPQGPMPEYEASVTVGKRRDMDPDLWVIEIEDREGRHFLTEPVEAADKPA